MAPDNETRKHGWPWYLGWMLGIYVATFLPVTILVKWAWERDLISSATAWYVNVLYAPIVCMIVVTGTHEIYSQFREQAIRLLP